VYKHIIVQSHFIYELYVYYKGFKQHDAALSRFDTIPECDRQTNRQTYDDSIYRASIASRGKKSRLYVLTGNNATAVHIEALCVYTKFVHQCPVLHFPSIGRLSRWQLHGGA